MKELERTSDAWLSSREYIEELDRRQAIPVIVAERALALLDRYDALGIRQPRVIHLYDDGLSLDVWNNADECLVVDISDKLMPAHTYFIVKYVGDDGNLVLRDSEDDFDLESVAKYFQKPQVTR